MAYTLSKWMVGHCGQARHSQYMSISKLCSYLLRHDKSISHGNDCGVAVSVVLHEMRNVAGGNSGRQYPSSGNNPIELLVWGSNKLRLQVFFVNGDGPLALRAIPGHSVIDPDPPPMS